jgi:hypothetical protein
MSFIDANEYMKQLKISNRINSKYDQAVKTAVKNMRLGIEPLILTDSRTIEEQKNDTQLQLQLANKELLTFIRADQVQQILNKMTDDDIYLLNSHIGKIKNELKDLKNITESSFTQFFKRYKEYLDINNQTTLPIPLSEESMRRLSEKLRNEWIEWSKNEFNPLTQKLYDLNTLIEKSANQIGVPVEAIKQEIQAFREVQKEFGGFDESIIERRTKGDFKERQKAFKAEFPELFGKNVSVSRSEAISFYTQIIEKDYMDVVPVNVARVLVKTFDPNIKIKNERAYAQNKLREVFNRGGVSSMTGSGVSIKKSKKSVVDNKNEVIKATVKRDRSKNEMGIFGRHIIDLDVLRKKNLVSVKYPSGVNIIKLKQRRVSNEFKNLLLKFIEDGLFDKTAFNGLDESETDYMVKLARFSNLRLPIQNMSEKEDQDLRRFSILQGEVIAGNNSSQIINELKQLLLKLSNNGLISKNDRDQVLFNILQVL